MITAFIEYSVTYPVSSIKYSECTCEMLILLCLMTCFVVSNITACKCSLSVNDELSDSKIYLDHQPVFYFNFLFAVELCICFFL